MKKWLMALALGMIVMALPAQAKQELKPWQKKALALVKKEKKVLDAFWRDPEHNVLFVTMEPNGTRRDGFAQYLCMQVMSAGAPKGKLNSIWIYDPETFRKYVDKTGSGSEMGWAFCRR